MNPFGYKKPIVVIDDHLYRMRSCTISRHMEPLDISGNLGVQPYTRLEGVTSAGRDIDIGFVNWDICERRSGRSVITILSPVRYWDQIVSRVQFTNPRKAERYSARFVIPHRWLDSDRRRFIPIQKKRMLADAIGDALDKCGDEFTLKVKLSGGKIDDGFGNADTIELSAIVEWPGTGQDAL